MQISVSIGNVGLLPK